MNSNLLFESQDLYESYEIFKESALHRNEESRFFLLKCREKGINLKKILSEPQIYVKDYFCFLSEQSIKRNKQRRDIILKRIRDITCKANFSIVKVLDLHAGIGRFGKLQIIYEKIKGENELKKGYLVDGLAWEINNTLFEYTVVEAGISSTLSFFDELYLELLNRAIRKPDIQSKRSFDYSNFE